VGPKQPRGLQLRRTVSTSSSSEIICRISCL
jgi:hypothetical protein